MPSPDFQVKFIERNGHLHWQSNPGPQTWMLLCRCDEILIGGSRGGGKSAGLIAWFAMGDDTLPANDPARISFLNDPNFRGLMLREEYQNLAEFVEEATAFFRPFKVKAKDDPVVFEFPSGAKIYTNHLGNEEAYNKYRGWNITKIAVEELTQVPTLKRYLKLLGSLRSKPRIIGGKPFPKLRTQIASSCNPDGPGAQWVKQRFVEVYSKGKLLPWNTVMRDPISNLTRIFIPARISDNPYLREDKKYMGMLLSQDEVTRQQWIEGDWNAGGGIFFRDYRPDGPRGKEETEQCPWANHRIDPVELKPWWYRWGSGDWGYDHPAAFHKFCRNEKDKRIHVYDELVVRQMDSFELGAVLAKWWMPDLHGLPDNQITIYLSPDAFSKQDAPKTKAERMEAGIKEVLGPYGCILLKYNEDERDMMSRNPRRALEMLEWRKKEVAGHLCIALKPMYVNRIDGWSYMRELLRFRPAAKHGEPTEEELRNLLQTQGIEAYEARIAEIRTLKPEILPRLQIWRACDGLDRCLKNAERDSDPTGANPRRNEDVRKFNAEDGIGGDDELESARNGLCAFQEIETIIPKSVWVADRVGEVQAVASAAFGQEITDPTRLSQIYRCQQALYDKKIGGDLVAFNLPRASSMRHRSVQ